MREFWLCFVWLTGKRERELSVGKAERACCKEIKVMLDSM
jgi:hypothetical protein